MSSEEPVNSGERGDMKGVPGGVSGSSLTSLFMEDPVLACLQGRRPFSISVRRSWILLCMKWEGIWKFGSAVSPVSVLTSW